MMLSTLKILPGPWLSAYLEIKQLAFDSHKHFFGPLIHLLKDDLQQHNKQN